MPDPDIKNLLEAYKEETKRHFNVVAEDVGDQISAVAEQVVGNAERLDRVGKQIGKMGEDVAVIKLDIEFIKQDLRKKVNLEEFAALEKRVSLLEAKRVEG